VRSLSRSQSSDFLDPQRGPIFTPRFIVTLVLAVLGIAWIAYYYVAVRVDPTVFPEPEPGGPGFMADLEKWNYAIGVGLVMIGLFVAAHPSTPLGRNRGVVVSMLGCFLVGLVWICTYYVFTGTDLEQKIWVFNDLGQYNLIVGIAFMAVGFSYATRWE
jgi:drug/metabolite transporter (DMT)-like permease